MSYSAIVGVNTDAIFPGADSIRAVKTLPTGKVFSILISDYPVTPNNLTGIYVPVYTCPKQVIGILEQRLFSPKKDSGPVILGVFPQEHPIATVIHDYVRLLSRVGQTFSLLQRQVHEQMNTYNKTLKTNPDTKQKIFFSLKPNELLDDIITIHSLVEKEIGKVPERPKSMSRLLVESSILGYLEALVSRLEGYVDTK